MTWLEVAKELPLGSKTRVRCDNDCGTDNSMLVSHSTQGYAAYCFRDGKIGFQSHGYRSLDELKRVRELNEAASRPHTLEIPDDFTFDIPREHYSWLARGGISVSRARSLGIGWSPRLSRVVLPIYGPGGDVIYWQARAVLRDQAPKYLNPVADKTSLLAWPCNSERGSRAAGTCITEDFLSAARVGAHVRTCTALGTKLSPAQASQLVANAGEEPIFIWLDGDKAGKDGARAMRRQLSLLSDSVHVIETDLDPKCLSDRTIRDTLGLPQQTRRYTCWT